MKLTMLPEWGVHVVIICICGIVACSAQDIVIVSDYSPPAIYTATLGKTLNFKVINIEGGRRNISAPAAVDYDPVERRIYWTQCSGEWTEASMIARCDLKGNFYQQLIKNVKFVRGLALDTEGRKMYFSHEGMALESANLDGSGRKTLVRELLTSGHYVFFDGIGKRVFWADTIKGLVESCRLDGKNRTVHASGLEHPSDIFVEKAQLYLIDFGTDRVATAKVWGGADAASRKTLFQYPLVSTETHPNALAVTLQNEIYWVDRGHPKLQKIPKNIKEGQDVVPQDVGNVEFGWPSGLHIYEGDASNLRSASFALYLFVPMLLQILLKL